jgi:hypothetical protein
MEFMRGSDGRATGYVVFPLSFFCPLSGMNKMTCKHQITHHERIVLVPAHAPVLEPHVKGAVEQVLVIAPDVDVHGQALARGDAWE